MLAGLQSMLQGDNMGRLGQQEQQVVMLYWQSKVGQSKAVRAEDRCRHLLQSVAFRGTFEPSGRPQMLSRLHVVPALSK